MEKHIFEQIKYGLQHVPAHAIAGSFIKKSSEEVESFKARAGGTICGVCHPNENFEQIKNANIGWIRIDISYPFDSSGRITDGYASFRRRCESYKENGIKVMAVTPYPSQFIKAGVDPVNDEAEVKRVAEFLALDLKELCDALQITNEMGIPHFTLPLNMDQAARFIAIQAEAIKNVNRDILIGYNSAGPQADLHHKMKPYLKYMDYVGIDIYIGCFASLGGFMWFYDLFLKYLWSFTRKPILLQEFGYIGLGKPKSKAEKKELLMRYSVKSEKDARENIESFVSKLPKRMTDHVRHVSPDVSHQWEFIFKSDFVNHLYCELPRVTKIPGYPHTPEGQAKFFKDIIPRFYKMKYLCGEFIYCYSDSNECYICSQGECPTETKWGIVDADGKEKPSYYAVKKAFGDIKNIEKSREENV